MRTGSWEVADRGARVPQGDAASVLVVDDDAGKRHSIGAVLSPLGLTVVEADSGQAALRLIMEHDFAVILLDVRMPEMDGFETAALIRRRKQSEMTPIIFITAYSGDELGPGAKYVSGAVDFMFAPIQADELRAKVSVFVNLHVEAATLAERAREVQVSADQLRQLTDAAPIGIFRTDAEKKLIYTNPRWTEISNVSWQDAIGQDWDAIIAAPRSLGTLLDAGDADDSARGCCRYELTLPDSTSRVVLMTSEPILDANGETTGWVGTLADVTAEARADEERSRFQSLVQNSRDVISIIDKMGQVSYASPGIFEISGFRPEEITDVSGMNYIHPDDIEAVTMHLQEIVSTPDATKTFEVRTQTKSGEWIWIEIRAVNRIDDPSIQGIVLNYHDITARREAAHQLAQSEAQLGQAVKMEAVGRLAGGIAHDFNNILAVVLNYADFVADTLEEDHVARPDLAEIVKAGERARVLVHQLLAFSRQEVIQPSVIDLNEVVGGMATLLERSVGEDVELIVETASELSLTEADYGQLEQILLNLVVNARDSMPGGGQIKIATEDVSLEAGDRLDLEPGDYVCLTVTDNGSGIDPEILEHIFEPFFTTKERGEGTGLGLATVYGIVQRAHGGIYAESAAGISTSFHVYLPVTDEAMAEPVELKVSSGPDDATILVVEDEAAVRGLCVRILRRAGFEVLDVASATEALEACTSIPGTIDLLLTDVVMPDISGPALRDMVIPLRPEIKVLFMSGYTDELIATRGVLGPGEALIKKPFNASQLLKSVREALVSDEQDPGLVTAQVAT